MSSIWLDLSSSDNWDLGQKTTRNKISLGRLLSQRAGYARLMKLKHLVELWWANDGEVVARFGNAALIKHRDGKWQLKGGSHDDHLSAREWISLFLHEAVV